jgi:hypothetical protein
MNEETVNVNSGSRKTCQRHPFGGRQKTEDRRPKSGVGTWNLLERSENPDISGEPETLNETA